MLNTNDFDVESQYAMLSDNIHVVVLHPAAYSSHRILSQMLLDEEHLAYVHLTKHVDTVAAALQVLFLSLAGQLAVSGDDVPDSPIEAGQQLAAAMNKANSGPLLIDGYDGPVVDLLQDTIAACARALDSGRRIILSGRELPVGLVNDLASDNIVAMLPVDPQRLLVDYTQPAEDKIVLEVRAFGQGHVLVNGRPISQWEGQLPRALFFYFIDQAMTTRDQVFETFWPQLDAREATNVFHVTKRKVSEILGVHVTVYGSGFYRVAPDVELHYDVINFQEAVQKAVIASDDEAEHLYKVAIDLYHDDFLSSMDGDWVEKRRAQLRNTYTDALVGLARIYEDRDYKESALGLFLRAAASSPQREDLVRSIMSLYAALGQPGQAISVYLRLEDLLHEELGVEPDRQTSELADSIRARV